MIMMVFLSTLHSLWSGEYLNLNQADSGGDEYDSVDGYGSDGNMGLFTDTVEQ